MNFDFEISEVDWPERARACGEVTKRQINKTVHIHTKILAIIFAGLLAYLYIEQTREIQLEKCQYHFKLVKRSVGLHKELFD